MIFIFVRNQDFRDIFHINNVLNVLLINHKIKYVIKYKNFIFSYIFNASVHAL